MKASRVPIVSPPPASTPGGRGSPAMDSSMLGIRLAEAIRGDALSVEYQPQFDLRTGRGCGVEALARWVLTTGESVAPSVFIPLAERMELIHALGIWVLNSACKTGYPWSLNDPDFASLSVNVSTRQIDQGFSADIRECLKQTGFPPEKLELEITESVLIGDTDLTIQCLKQWKDLGVRIALDDFGTGYSSLSYLSRLPVDRLKLDQSLIRRLTVDRKSAIIVRSILALAEELGIDVLAEGVETEEQLQVLIHLGCRQAQGYLFGRPMSGQQALVALRMPWGNRPAPVFRPAGRAAGESRVN
jgi:EAL domain-containing protein (putative c-di-GMP-specific phosphodiesterase class I)